MDNLHREILVVNETARTAVMDNLHEQSNCKSAERSMC